MNAVTQKKMETEPDRDETRQANQSKLTTLGQMAGSIAHEINNPLSVIRMNAEILLEFCGEGPNADKMAEKCRKIISTADRISGIIRALKSISASTSKPSFQWIEVSSVIGDVVDLCASRFKLADVPLTVDVEEIKDTRFFIDSAQVSQALINLLNNSFDAIQALPEKWVKLQGRIEGDRLVLRVTDSGGGIPEDILKNILNPFFSTKDKHSGLGIGLNLVQSYAAFHDGHLRYDPVDGHTSFALEFPLTKIQPPAQ